MHAFIYRERDKGKRQNNTKQTKLIGGKGWIESVMETAGEVERERDRDRERETDRERERERERERDKEYLNTDIQMCIYLHIYSLLEIRGDFTCTQTFVFQNMG